MPVRGVGHPAPSSPSFIPPISSEFSLHVIGRNYDIVDECSFRTETRASLDILYIGNTKLRLVVVLRLVITGRPKDY